MFIRNTGERLIMRQLGRWIYKSSQLLVVGSVCWCIILHGLNAEIR